MRPAFFHVVEHEQTTAEDNDRIGEIYTDRALADRNEDLKKTAVAANSGSP